MHTPSRTHAGPSGNRRRLAAVGLGLGLLLGPLAAAGSARTAVDRVDDTRERTVRPVDSVGDERPDAARPDREERPARDLEVLHLACSLADGEVADQPPTDRPTDRIEPIEGRAPESDTRVHIGCRWREAQSERAAGYQLWRVVDRGERELVARGGLDLLGARDVVSAEATLVRYAVIAVDEHGRRVGQSRVVRVAIGDVDPDGRIRARWARIGRIQ